MKTLIPDPRPDESPSAYADRLGVWYSAEASLEHRKFYGQYFTPRPVAAFMSGLFRLETEEVSLLDPGAGSGILTCAVAEHLAGRQTKPTSLNIVAYEADSVLAQVLDTCFAHLGKWLKSHGIAFEAAIHTTDFVMTHAEALEDALGDTPNLFMTNPDYAIFDMAVSNPPYFKIPKADPRAQAASTVIHGQPNIYALFMAATASVLKPGGQLVFITPRSYASGPYFRLFRERFFASIKPESIHVFHSRTDAFKRDEVLQENVILKAGKEEHWHRKGKRCYFEISSSNGSEDFCEREVRKIRSDLLLDMSGFDKVLHIPATDQELAVMETVRSWSGSLRKYGLKISTGPVVPFRAVPLLDEAGEVPAGHAPLIWMQHVKAMTVQWPIVDSRKPQFIKVTDSSMKLLVPNRNYVLIRRFSAKEEYRRLVAAPYLKHQFNSPWLGLENHLNYIHRPGGELTEEEALGLSVLYNCSILDTYFRTLNGNTQVSATELRAMPLPDKRVIRELGEVARDAPGRLDNIDSLVETVVEGRSRYTVHSELRDLQQALP